MSRQRRRSQAALGHQRFHGSDPVRADQLLLLERATPPPQRVPALTAAVPASRGGNRLSPGHPSRGRAPSYPRCRTWRPDPERRDRNQRARVRRAAAAAQKQGSLSPTQTAVLFALLDASDDYLNEAWWRLSTIAKLVYGEERYGEDPSAGQRTAGRWMAELRQLGWVERVHRFHVVRGQRRWTSNLWRFVIPEEFREAVTASEDARRARTLRRSTTPPGAQAAAPAEGAVPAEDARASSETGPAPEEVRAASTEKTGDEGATQPLEAAPEPGASASQAAEHPWPALARDGRARLEEINRQAAARDRARQQAAQQSVDAEAALKAAAKAELDDSRWNQDRDERSP